VSFDKKWFSLFAFLIASSVYGQGISVLFPGPGLGKPGAGGGVSPPSLIVGPTTDRTFSASGSHTLASVNTGDVIHYAVTSGTASATFTVTDNCNTGGSTDTNNIIQGPTTGNGGTYQVGYFIVGAGRSSCQVSYTASAGSFTTLILFLLRGTGAPDVSTAINAQVLSAGTNNITTAAATTSNPDLCVASTIDQNSGGGTFTAGSTIAWGNFATNNQIAAEAFTQSASGSITATFSDTSASQTQTQMSCYSGNGGGGGGPTYAYATGSVSGCYNFNAASTKCIFPIHITLTAGQAISCGAVWSDSGAQSVTLTGTLNGSYTAAGSKEQGVGGVAGTSGQMFNVTSSGGGSETITMQISSGTTPFFATECVVYTKSSGTPSLDGTPQYSNTQASGTTATINGLTTVSSTGVLIAHCLGLSGSACSAPAGFTARNDTSAINCVNPSCSSTTTANFNANGGGGLIEDKFNSPSGSQSAQFTVGSNNDVILGLEALQ
jgi:hypothetical protein